MHARGLAAVVAGMVGAAAAHALDAAGLLPGVHEAVGVRQAMGPTATLAWLALAGALAWVAAMTRPAPVGAVAALVVSGIPELVGRHDPGALAEPGAIAGALVQWLLLVAVITVVLVVDHRLGALTFVLPSWRPQWAAVPGGPGRAVSHVAVDRGRPRGPPPDLLPSVVLS